MVLGAHGITVNCISPGAVLTPIFLGGADVAAQLEPAHSARRLQKVQRTLDGQNPLRRHGLARDVANAALFLASDAGSYINCHDLVVDGGMTAGGKLDYGV
jgi:NAD(P)-dependent dehydrogenase (short-subunit alcohol dehydrogenase family)